MKVRRRISESSSGDTATSTLDSIPNLLRRNTARSAVNDEGRLRRDAFEQQWLHCSYPAIRMEPPAHDAVIERVIDGHQTHALVMRHVSVDDHSLATLPLLLPGVV